nr:MAG TPA: hypothetical protein [Caudoviricetes sp.]
MIALYVINTLYSIVVIAVAMKALLITSYQCTYDWLCVLEP